MMVFEQLTVLSLCLHILQHTFSNAGVDQRQLSFCHEEVAINVISLLKRRKVSIYSN